jgi:GNAT superfamily N-acetyltransferase
MSDACRHATLADVPALLETMVSGFDDDPLYAWLYPAADGRPDRLHEGFALILAGGMQHGHVYTNAGRSAVAVCMAPNVELMNESEVAAFLGLIRRQIGDRVEDVIVGMSATVANRPREPHFTLHNVVVRRDAQGRGIGAALLGPILARCDEDGLPTCLDSSNIRNVPFYERLGFEVTGETRVPGDGPVVQSMLRAPR